MEKHFKYVAEKIAEIESFCSENSNLAYSEMESRVIVDFEKIEQYAKENKVPIKLDLDLIIEKHSEPDDCEDYCDASSYYEEPESNYEDEDEDEEVNSWD